MEITLYTNRWRAVLTPPALLRKEIADDLLDPARELIHADNVLMDHEFDSQHVPSTGRRARNWRSTTGAAAAKERDPEREEEGARPRSGVRTS